MQAIIPGKTKVRVVENYPEYGARLAYTRTFEGVPVSLGDDLIYFETGIVAWRFDDEVTGRKVTVEVTEMVGENEDEG